MASDPLDDARDLLRDAARPLGHWPGFRDGAAPIPSRRPTVLALIESLKIRLVSLSRELARRLKRGLKGFGPWPRDFLSSIAAGHAASAMVASGTIDPAPADLAIATDQAAWHQGRFRRFRKKVADAKDVAYAVFDASRKVSAEFLRKSAMFAGGLWATGEAVTFRRFRADGFDEELWQMSAADHCEGCPYQASRGWVPIGTLPAIGSQPCRFGCRCSKHFRHTASGLVVPSPFAVP